MSKTIGMILSISDKCSPQLSKIADKMGITEKEAKRLHAQTQKLKKALSEDFKRAAGICAAGFAAINAAASAMVMHSIEAADRIDKMSQKMQMSRKTFQELDYVFSQNGADIQIMQIGMTKLAKIMENAQRGNKLSIRAFQQLGINLKKSNGQLKTTEEVLFEVFAQLQKMPESARKTALAIEFFGKSASELAPLLNKDAKSVNELRKKFNDLGMGMSKQQIDAAVKFKDTMDTLTRTFESLGNQIGADLLPTLQKVADTLIKNMPQIKAVVVPVMQTIGKVLEFTIEHFKGLSIAVGVCAGVFAAFKVAAFIDTIILMKKNIEILVPAIELMSLRIKAIEGLTWAWTAANNALNLSILNNPYVRGVMALGGAIAVGQAAKQKIYDTLDEHNTEDYKVPEFAGGTNFASGGLSLVGEKGPELVNLPKGSKVLNNSDTQKALGNNITVNLNIGGSVISEGDLINKISMVLGSQLQTALQC